MHISSLWQRDHHSPTTGKVSFASAGVNFDTLPVFLCLLLGISLSYLLGVPISLISYIKILTSSFYIHETVMTLSLSENYLLTGEKKRGWGCLPGPMPVRI